MLKLLKSSSDIPMKKFWNPCFKAFCSDKIVLAAILNLEEIKINLQLINLL